MQGDKMDNDFKTPMTLTAQSTAGSYVVNAIFISIHMRSLSTGLIKIKISRQSFKIEIQSDAESNQPRTLNPRWNEKFEFHVRKKKTIKKTNTVQLNMFENSNNPAIDYSAAQRRVELQDD
jgi:hypothetical protein